MLLLLLLLRSLLLLLRLLLRRLRLLPPSPLGLLAEGPKATALAAALASATSSA